MIHLALSALFFAAIPSLAAGNLEVPAPGSTQSGVDAISGWHCTANKIEITIDEGPRMVAGVHTERLDTRGVCGRTDTGFSLTYNWNLLPVTCFGCRFHRIAVYADGAFFAGTQFEVEHYRTEFLAGKNGQYDLNNFLEIGSISVLRWDEAKQNFALNLLTLSSWYKHFYTDTRLFLQLGSVAKRRKEYSAPTTKSHPQDTSQGRLIVFDQRSVNVSGSPIRIAAISAG